MAVDFSKIENKPVGLVFYCMGGEGSKVRELKFGEFIASYLDNPLKYKDICQKLEKTLKDTKKELGCYVNDCDKNIIGFDETYVAVRSSKIMAIQNSLKLIRDYYTLRLLAEAGLLPEYFLVDI